MPIQEISNEILKNPDDTEREILLTTIRYSLGAEVYKQVHQEVAEEVKRQLALHGTEIKEKVASLVRDAIDKMRVETPEIKIRIGDYFGEE